MEKRGTDYFSAYPQVEAHLEKLGLFRMQPGLERMIDVLDRLGLRRPPFKVIQVAGTNGKGSTSAMLASLAAAHGLKAGFGSSPHFISVRERTRVDGQVLGEGAWLKAANTLMANGGEQLSYFEFVVALSIVAFADEGVDIAVMETGLGGTWDATTALGADLVVITPIAMDHQAVLGDSLSAIAGDKAGALRENGAAITAPQKPEAMAELEARAAAVFSSLDKAPDSPSPEIARLFSASGVDRPFLGGLYQAENATLALAAWRLARRLFYAGTDISERLTESELKGLQKAWMPGRLQRIPPMREYGLPPLLLDGAHNIHAMAALGHSLAREGIAPSAVIFTCLEDKEPRELAAHLRALSFGPVFIPPLSDNPRGIAPIELAKLVGLSATCVKGMAEALSAAAEFTKERFPEVYESRGDKHPVLICGSLYLLADFYTLYPQWLTPPTT